MERNIGEHIFLCSVLVFEPHMVKFDLTFCHGNVFCIFICDIDFFINDFHDPLCGCQRPCHEQEHI